MGQGKTNTMDFAEAIDSSDLEAFGFTDDFIFELWGAITDAKAGRLRKWRWQQQKQTSSSAPTNHLIDLLIVNQINNQ